MATYFLAYVGGESGMGASPEEQQRIMQAWGAWMGGLGSAMVDGGAPLGAHAAVTSSGRSDDVRSGLGGYSIITADSLEAAVAATKGCPHLDTGGTVEVYETINVEM